ncbi:multiheme c-type cytochrome [Calderihabitans maritimus]|uniref:Hypothetical cytochrome protein n=1 Tax=Calderihabitans maritimus TaxID=1246530 RepID=A0A1Z5HPX2_9FIRM|nr:multiheme c-type cytochrome [Calderihabitans maritimus]GAW91573.1 hypothetical cytochrome protein [Calderihabitans maritimus]
MFRNKNYLLHVLLSTLLLSLLLAAGCLNQPREQEGKREKETPPSTEVATYVGSEKCSGCHKEIYNQWKETMHAKSLQQKGWDKFELKGDFTAGKLDYKAMKEGGGRLVDIVLHEDGTVTIGEKDYKIFGTYGGWDEWKQRYLTKDVDDPIREGNIYILPIQWNQKTEEWVPYHADEGHGEPSKKNWWRPERTFEKNCSGCHNTGLALKWNADGYVTDYSYQEFNTGCENCHGAGSLHADNPSPENIINPAKLAKKAANEVCGQCHSRGKSKPEGLFGFPWKETVGNDGRYKIGDDLSEYYTEGGGYWGEDKNGDGRVSLEESVASQKHHQQWWDFMTTAHYKSDSKNAPKTCFSCHSPHDDGFQVGDKKFSLEQVRNNELCLECHQDRAPFNGARHHFGDSKYTAHANIRCTACHMPRTAKSAVWDEKGLGDIHSHRLNVIPPSYKEVYNMPTSCIECHTNATDEQVEEMIQIVKEAKKE